MIKKKIGHTRFIITEGNPLLEETDALINWTVTSLMEGDQLFHLIHTEGGSQIKKELLRYLSAGQVAMSQVLVTNTGMLPARKLLHAVIPNYRIKEEKEAKTNLIMQTYYNVFTFVENYTSELEALRRLTFTPIPVKVFGTVTEKDISIFIKTLIERSTALKLREIKIICTPATYHLYAQEFQNQTTTRFERFLEKIGL